MAGRFLLVVALAAVGLVAAAPGAGAASPASAVRPVCPPRTQAARCAALVASDPQTGAPLSYPSPPGLDPADFWSAYGLPSQTGTSWSWNGETVAVVDAYDDPTVEADLNAYRSAFGLPPCTSAHGCFVKVNQQGRKSYPSFDEQWAFEISIDTQMVSALCASCRIVLVETKSNTFPNLFAGVDEAYALGARTISLSWGTTEFAGSGRFGSETDYDSHFEQRNAAGETVAVTAASGDSGALWYPAASPDVTAVGGTSLDFDATTGTWNEIAWLSAGAGCSLYEPQPSWQSAVPAIASVCSRRAGADVSFNASDLSIYDTAGYENQTGWFSASGTSDSAPAIAAVYALAGNADRVGAGSYPYDHASSLYDVTQFQSASCAQPIFCNPEPGWDGPTGLGSPRGTGGF